MAKDSNPPGSLRIQSFGADRLGLPRGRMVAALAAAVVVSSVVLVSLIARTPEPDLTRGLTGGASIFVAPSGRADVDGTIERPMDLQTALSGTVKPGTTVWLRAGTYSGVFRSDLTGTEQQPIVVRPYPGEHATIDSAPFGKSALEVYGAWTTYRDFEILSSSRKRDSALADTSQPTDLTRGPGVDSHGPYTKFVNLVVHDLAGGFDVWSDAVGAELTGNIIYNNGWKAGGRNNGHGIYTQNKEGVRRLTDNVIFNQFAAGVHAYGSEDAFLDNVVLEGNVAFNNGMLGQKYDRNILIGGGRIAQHPVLIGNHTYYSPGLRNGQNNIGYQAGCEHLEARDNYFASGEFGFSLETVNCTGTIRQNTFVGELRSVENGSLVNHLAVKARFPENTYVDQPTGVQVFVRPSKTEHGRATIIVYNWAKKKQVDVDLSQARLDPGTTFEIRDAQNYAGDPILSATYKEPHVQLPMSGLTAALPIGDGLDAPSHTGPEFAVFVLAPAAKPGSVFSQAMAALRRAF